MGKISRSPACSSTMERLRTELKETKGRLKRKRRRKDLDVLRQNVLEMRKSLRKKATKSRGTSFTKLLNKFADKRQENDSRTQPADGKDQRGARICNRLLPKSTAGIFTHGAKGKDIRKANLRLSELDEARLQGNVFKLVNGDESGTKDGLAEKIFGDILNGTADCSNGTVLEIVGERANAGASHGKECKKKQEAKQRQEDVLEHRSVKADESERSEADPVGECADKGPKCKRRLFQGKRNDSVENERANSVESAFSTTAYGRSPTDKSSTRKPEVRPINYRDYCWSPITRYRQLAAIVSKENFDNQDYLNDTPAETLAKIKDRLKIHLRGEGTQAYRTKIRKCLHGSASSNSRTRPEFFASDQSCIEVQACTYSEESESSSPRCFRDLRLDIHAEDCEEAILQKGDDLVSIIPANREAEQSENVNELPLTSLPSDLFERPSYFRDNLENMPRLVDAGIERSSHDSRDRSNVASFAVSCDSASLKNFVESDVTINNKRYLLARYLEDVDGSVGVDNVPLDGKNLSRDDCEAPANAFKDRRENPGRARRGLENSRHVPAILRRANNNNLAKTDGASLIDNANPSDEDCRVVFARVPLGKNPRNQDAGESISAARSWQSLRKEEDFLAPDSMSGCQREVRIMPSSRCVKRSKRKESFPAESQANVRRYSQESREQGIFRAGVDVSKPRYADKDEMRSDFANSQSMLRLQDGGSQERQSDGKNLRANSEAASRPQNHGYHDSKFTVQFVGKEDARPDFANVQSMLRLQDGGNQGRYSDGKNLRTSTDMMQKQQSQYYPDSEFMVQLINKNEARPILRLQDDGNKEMHADGKNYRTNVDVASKPQNQYYPNSQFTMQLVDKNETRADFRGNLQSMLRSHGNGNQDRHADVKNYRTSIGMIPNQHQYYPDPKFTFQLVNKSEGRPDFRANLQDTLNSQDNSNQDRLADVKDYSTNISMISKPQDQYYDDPEFTMQLVNKPEARPDFRTNPQDTLSSQNKDNQDRRADVKNLPAIQLEEEARRREDVLLFEPAASRSSRGECHRFVAPRQTLPDDKRLEYFARRYGVQGTASKPQTSANLRFSDSGEPTDVGILSSVQDLQFLTLEGSQELPGVNDCVQPDKYLAYENEASCSERIPVYLPDSRAGKSFQRVILVPRDGAECDYVFGQKNVSRTEAEGKEYFPGKPLCRERATNGEVLVQVREPEVLNRARCSTSSLQRRIREARDAIQQQSQAQASKVGVKATERQEVTRQVRPMNRKIGVLVPKGYARQTIAREVYLSRASQGCAEDSGVAQFQDNGAHSQSKYTMQEESKTAFTMFPKSNL